METKQIISLTDNAVEEIKKYLEEENVVAIRIEALPGGCSGFRYSISTETDTPMNDDVVIESGGIKIYLDEFSIKYIDGTVIDYVKSFQESSFTFNNPNASGGCGCGLSFSV